MQGKNHSSCSLKVFKAGGRDSVPVESAHSSEMLSLSQISHTTNRDLIPAKPQLSYKESSESRALISFMLKTGEYLDIGMR